MDKKRYLFEEMPVPKALATLAVPTIISQLITMIYNIADTYFIGQTNDPYKVAASSIAFVLIFAMNCLSNLFGVGGGSLISRLLGQHRDGEASRVAAFSFYGSLAISAVYSVLLYIFMDPFLRLLGATDNTIAYASDYALWVVVFGAIPSTLGLTLSHLFRSEGYAKHSSIGLALGGVLNIALDPLFMFVILEPGNEVRGAAIATMISNIAVLIYFLVVYFVIRKKTVLSISPLKVLCKKEHVASVFAVGCPSALGSFLACLSSIMINKLASGHGDIEVAAIGIAKKIDMLPMNVGMGLCQGMMPLVAYNYSAKNYKRMKQFSDAARTAGIVFAGVCIVLFEIFAEQIVGIFIDEPTTVMLGTRLLRIMCLAVPLMIVNFQMAFTFQAMGMGKESLLLSSLRQGLVNIPLLLLMNRLFAVNGIAWTQLLSDTITTAISFVIYFHAYKKLIKSTEISVEKSEK